MLDSSRTAQSLHWRLVAEFSENIADDRRVCLLKQGAAAGAALASANRYRNTEETRVDRFVVSSNRDSVRSFSSLSPNELIHNPDDRVEFVRPGRIREKNLFPNARDAADLIEWHMPLMPATVVKRNAVRLNSVSNR